VSEFIAPAIVGFVVLFVGVLVLGLLAEGRRSQACRALAEQLGLSYADHDKSYVSRYGFLKLLDTGSLRRVDNILKGQYKGYNVKAFDYQYQPEGARARSGGTGRTSRTYRCAVLLLEHERDFPEVHIFRKGLLSKLGGLVSDRNVPVPNREFEAAFCVRARDEDFARALCSDELMNYLLQHRDLTLEFKKHCIAMTFRRRLKVSRIADRLDQLVAIRECLPRELFQGDVPSPTFG
jgi:hypothetical protein